MIRLALCLGLLCACVASWAAIVVLLVWLITWSR